MKLSIVMMIKNESKHLERCLKSLKPIQAAVETEIIVVDTGSEDNSVEIAKRYTDKVYYHQWNNDFGAMRNITISYAKGEWIFVLDGDEVIEDPDEFINFFKSINSVQYNTGFIRLKNFTNEQETKFGTGYIPRVFKRNKDFKYTGTIHEQPTFREPLFRFNTYVLHYGYVATDPELVEKKFLRNSQLLKRELEINPKDAYNWFQLSQTYSMYGKHEESLETALKAYEISKANNTLYRCMYIYNHLADMYFIIKDFEQTERICEEALKVKDGYIDLYFLLANSQKSLLKNAEAIKNYNIYLDMIDHYEDFEGSKDISVTTYTLDSHELAYANLCNLYCEEKEYEKVLEYVVKLHTLDILKLTIHNIVTAYIKLFRYAELKEFYDTKVLTEFETLHNVFVNSLEYYIPLLKKQERELLLYHFSKGDSIYSLLNIIRKENKQDGTDFTFTKAYLERLEGVDFNKLPAIYGEIFYYLLKYKKLNIDALKHLKDTTLETYFYNLLIQYKKECADYITTFMNEEVAEGTIDHIRIRKVLGKMLLISSVFKKEKCEDIFKQYIKDGIAYINLVYSKDIILDERVIDVKNEEEAMLIYLDRAEEAKHKDKPAYIKYLKKAFDIYPSMAMGINIFIKWIEEETEKQKKETKEKIKGLIDTGNLLRAHALICEYEKFNKDDIQILSMKAIIAIMEDNLSDAEIIINEGLNIENNNYDLLYNLKYVYESYGKIAEAEAVQKRIAYSMPTQRYLDPSIPLKEFFEIINQEDIRYVVLRYQEVLPNTEQADNLAILVHDEDIVKISKYFIPYQLEDSIQCDVYTLRALDGSTDALLPSYPVSIAESILKNRILHDEKIYTPCTRDYSKYIDKNSIV